MRINCFLSTLFSFVILIVFFHGNASAQFPYNEPFKNATASGVIISGAAKLTAATGIDPVGSGYLRLTDNVQNSVGYIYAQASFPSYYGITATVEFFTYKPGASVGTQADGISFFLFDASVNAFRPGGIGGSLGYAQYYQTPGMAKGYLGIAIDEYGNFSSAPDGLKNGGPGRVPGSVSLRGPGNGRTATDYVYQAGVIASDPAYSSGFALFTARYPDSTTANYRRLQVILTPGSSLGADKGYKVTVRMFKGGNPVTSSVLMNNLDFPYLAPANLQYGLAASTGANTDFHEIRNVQIYPTNSTALLTPTAAADAATACPGQPVLVDVATNDASRNVGGVINKATVDLDPVTAGRQTTYTDPSKGTYTVNASGIVTFTAQAGFSGTSTINYSIADNYGVSSTPSTISVTINTGLAPSLTVTSPAAVCGPAIIDITNASLRSNTTSGAAYDYFSTISDAYGNTNNINSTAATINQAGTYYIRANVGGCYNVQPVVVDIATIPTTSNAGADQNNCSSSGTAITSTLLGNNPDAGSGTWSQVSGPSTASITFPNAATSPVTGMQNGVYMFRWTISNGACASSADDIQISNGVASVAGAAQSLCNATSTTLQGNTATAGTGAWSITSGSGITITTPSSPTSTVTGLTPGNAYTLNWRITTGSCISNSTVVVNDLANTLSNAGVDQILPLAGPFTLGANVAGASNTGTWSLVSSPPSATYQITNVNNPSSAASIGNVGDFVFRWTVTNGSCSNFDDVTISALSALPVSLISFEGKASDKFVHLAWKTAGEVSNDHFDIERSNDGINFIAVGKVNGAGTTQSERLYAFDDPLVGSSAVIYYRLKQVDRDGKFSYSNVIKLTTPVLATINCSPNPFSDYTVVKFSYRQAGKAELRMIDENGKIIKTRFEDVHNGTNSIRLDGMQNLKAGAYILEIHVKDLVSRYKLIKK